MQRLMFASATLVLAVFVSDAAAVQDLPGYDLHRGAGHPSSFYGEGFAGYPGSYGAGMYVAGYGYAGNGYSGMGGPFCCGARVMQGYCNPWAGYTPVHPCGWLHGHLHRGHCSGAGCGEHGGYGVNGGSPVQGPAVDAAPAIPPAQPIPPAVKTDA
jgi:hypothetical protein